MCDWVGGEWLGKGGGESDGGDDALSTGGQEVGRGLIYVSMSVCAELLSLFVRFVPCAPPSASCPVVPT